MGAAVTDPSRPRHERMGRRPAARTMGAMAARFTAPTPITVAPTPARRGGPAFGGSRTLTSGAASNAVPSIGSAGRPLDPIVRPELERQFGMSLASVRIHSDGIGSALRASPVARAVTVGEHIVVGDAASPEGARPSLGLLAHELAHVAQHRRWTAGGGVAADPAMVEADADRAAADVAAGRSVRSTVAAAPGIHAQERVETSAEAREEQRLRRLGHWPYEALQRWAALSEVQRMKVAFSMAGDYGVEFAQEFLRNARLPRGRRREPVAEFTNAPTRTPAQRRAAGWAYAGEQGGLPTWVHPHGDEIHIISSQPSPTSSRPSPTPSGRTTPPSSPAEPPATLPPRSSWGRVVDQRDGASVGGVTGRATRYADGTVSIVGADGSTMTYRPHPDSVGGYDIYDNDGHLIENVIWTLDPDDVFGHAGGGSSAAP